MKVVLETLQDGVHKRVKKKQTDVLKKMETHSKLTQTRLERMYKEHEQEIQEAFRAFLDDEKTRARSIGRVEYGLAQQNVELKKIVKSFFQTTKQEVETTDKQFECIIHQIDRLQEHEAGMSHHALRQYTDS
ncbi:hypothetical protein CROQUDRAFT_663999 [Cronartium quercuum f. sp. fusiforme G11]|uniref:Uncharacterized protein n=1 Tax=Cronartium quercuum f. sp. fusiforme G11 TaxID=708437 RepID=A0A9P6N967_9BASI|nr:hypothetical protein CROQUDRAFT_663999 [Cronartium quercuum f. sp. fusiforme G11]